MDCRVNKRHIEGFTCHKFLSSSGCISSCYKNKFDGGVKNCLSNGRGSSERSYEVYGFMSLPGEWNIACYESVAEEDHKHNTPVTVL